MKLGWKDSASTVLVAVGLTLALAAAQGWNWPLLGGVRQGIIALTVFGFGAHLLGEPRGGSYFSDPFGLITMIIAIAAIALAIVGGLITGLVEYLVVLMAVITMLWALATLRHAVEGRSTLHRGTPA